MQFLIGIPLLFHIFLNRKCRKICMVHMILSCFLLVIAVYLDHAIIYALILLFCFLWNTRGAMLLFMLMLLIFYCTYTLEYYLLVWIVIVLGFMIHASWINQSYDTQLSQYQNKVFEKQVLEVEHMFTTMRGWRHDYHNHLQNLKAKLKQGDVCASLTYLDELEQELRDIHMLVESDNPNMDAVLNSKLSLAIANGIQVHVKVNVHKQLAIRDTDLCVLLGNMIDNAVEACMKLSNEDGFIRLYIGQYKGQFYISCTNSTNEIMRKRDEDYISKKRGNHGHGLKRMNRVVEKYEGIISRKNEPGIFVTEILLPL